MKPGTSSTSVVLVGPMGSGKTTVAREIAAQGGLHFVDMDQRIVEESGPIPEIFASRGEEAFRALETEQLTRALAEDSAVIATGGGVVLAEANRAALADAFVVFLDVDVDTVRSRIRGADNRPVLAGDDPFATWQRVLDERLPLYREIATLVVDARHDSPAALAAHILGCRPVTARPHITHQKDRSEV